ncbi:MAG: MYG1 family protein [Candidatus Caldatribacteriota bacterium]
MKIIFVHSGIFHADDAFCVAAAKMAGFGPEIMRVRELPEDFNFEKGDIALDIGGKYSPLEGVYDHHQKGGGNDGRAAIGKFWAHYGARICGDNEIADRVYLTLLGSVDRADIGISDWSPICEDWRHLSASALISSMNPPFGADSSTVLEAFKAAVTAATFALKGAIAQAVAYCEMREAVISAAKNENRRLFNVLELPKGGPWQEHIFELDLTEVLFVIYPSERGGYYIQTVPDKPGSFGMRKGLPAAWAGLRGEELASKLDLSTSGSATFCHPGRFIGGAETLSDVKKMAELAVMATA